MRGNLPNSTMNMLYCLSLPSPETIDGRGGKAPGKVKLTALSSLGSGCSPGSAGLSVHTMIIQAQLCLREKLTRSWVSLNVSCVPHSEI